MTADNETCPACGKAVYRAVYPTKNTPETACIDPECVNAHGIPPKLPVATPPDPAKVATVKDVLLQNCIVAGWHYEGPLGQRVMGSELAEWLAGAIIKKLEE